MPKNYSIGHKSAIRLGLTASAPSHGKLINQPFKSKSSLIIFGITHASSSALFMSKGLDKTRKKIACKKGNVRALHENSRDSWKLKRAQLRDEKLEKIALIRKKTEKPLREIMT